MNKREQFLEAVQILAPGDADILFLAKHLVDDRLLLAPGAAALEFVARLERSRHRRRQEPRARRRPPRYPSAHPPKAWVGGPDGADPSPEPFLLHWDLSFAQSQRLDSAEYWLQEGQPEWALVQLGRLPQAVHRDPWVRQLRAAALDALRAREQVVVQE